MINGNGFSVIVEKTSVNRRIFRKYVSSPRKFGMQLYHCDTTSKKVCQIFHGERFANKKGGLN